MINLKEGFVGIIVLIVASIALVGGGFYVYQQQQSKATLPAPEISIKEQENDNVEITTTKTIESSKNVDTEGLKADINIKADVTEIVNCGAEDCFQKKFSACQPATYKADTGFVATEYKIIGPADSGCKVTFKYTTNPNPEWVNKEMTCTFDNKIDFEKSFQNTFEGAIAGSATCTGSLYTILKSM